MIKLEDTNLDEEGREMYAEEVDGKEQIVRREEYKIDTSCLIDRLSQVRKIDKLFREKGFENYGPPFSFNLWGEDLWSRFVNEGLPHGSLGEQLCNRRYINNNGRGTKVSVRENPILDGLRTLKKSLEIEVHSTGDFEDYVWTCNLFRKFFGLKE